jgi:hypothetical protein
MWLPIFLLSFVLKHHCLAIQADCGDFSIAPGSEYPYAYHIESTGYGSWQGARATCKTYHPECDLAISRNEATRLHLNDISFAKLHQRLPDSFWGVFLFGLIQNSTAMDSLGGWYWVDGRPYNPFNESDERYFSGGYQLRQVQVPSVGGVAYAFNITSSVTIWDLWGAFNFSVMDGWSLWEIPSNFSSVSVPVSTNVLGVSFCMCDLSNWN